MADPDARFSELLTLIVADDGPAISVLLGEFPQLAQARAMVGATRSNAVEFWFGPIEHYLYAGDTALHIAAAAHRPHVIRELVGLGADPDGRNRRGARPLHYAADGGPNSAVWRPEAQSESVKTLIELGADPNATDASGVMPLHRAVRNRCASAVEALLAGGADPNHPNRSGSTPLQLAQQPTGRGGSGTTEAKAQQDEILIALARYGVRS